MNNRNKKITKVSDIPRSLPVKTKKVHRKENKVKKTFMVIICLAAVFIGVFVTALGLKTAHDKYVYSSYPMKYQKEVEQASKKYGVDKFLIYGVIKTESNFDPAAVSGAGAIGLMQIMPDSFEWLQTYYVDEEYADYTVGDLVNAEINIDYGTHLLKLMLDQFDGIEPTALCAYNAGPGNVESWLKNKEYSDDGKTIKKAPIGETDAYFRRVERNKSIFEKLYSEMDSVGGIPIDPSDIDPDHFDL